MTHPHSAFTLGLLALALLWTSGAAAREHVEVLGPVQLIGAQTPMEGPSIGKTIEFQQPLLLRSIRVQSLDRDGKPISNENLCHMTFAFARNVWQAANGSKPWHIVTLDAVTPRFEFPPGYGFLMEARQKFSINAMAVSSSPPTDRDLSFSIALDVVDNRSNIKPLRLAILGLRAADIGEKEITNPGDWRVPPGRHEYSAEVPSGFGGVVHVISVHLHRYARSYRIEDAQSKAVLIEKIFGSTDEPLASAQEPVSLYSDAKGFSIEKGRKYRLSVAYDNPLPTPVSAMGVFYVFYSGKDGGSDNKPKPDSR